MQIAINNELLRHKQAANPVCEIRNGNVVWIQPDEIEIHDPTA